MGTRTTMTSHRCDKCRAKSVHEIYIGVNKSADVCVKCYHDWYELRDKTIGDLFETFFRPQNDSKRVNSKPVA